MKKRISEKKLIIILLISAPFIGAFIAFVDTTVKDIQREIKFQQWAEARDAKMKE